MGDIHQLLLEFGKDGVLKSTENRQVVEAAAGFLAAEDGEVGFVYSGWAQAALPHKRLPDAMPWEVTSGPVSLIVQPGLKKIADGPLVSVGVPYGSRARLILIYLQSEALRTSSREIELGRSLRVWLGRLGIPIGGKSIAEVRDQCERISLCRMTFQITKGSRVGLMNQLILDQAMFEEEVEGRPRLLETVKLSESFFAELRRHPVPVTEAAIRQLANNSFALDVYCWLAYRLHALKTPLMVSWPALHAQFGRGFTQLKNFKPKFRAAVDLALAVYPEAKLDMRERGVTLHPSRAPVEKTLALAE
jgi:hypothetical protein